MFVFQLARAEPFGFAHFNDGELHALERTEGRTARGLQRQSSDLASHIKSAMTADVPNLVLGVPCARNYPYLHRLAMRTVNGSATATTAATLFINSNYKDARALLVEILKRRKARLHLLVSERADVERFKRCESADVIKTYIMNKNLHNEDVLCKSTYTSTTYYVCICGKTNTRPTLPTSPTPSP